MRESSGPDGEPPDWVFAFGPFVVIGLLFAGALWALSAVDYQWLDVTGTRDVLLVLTGIGFVAGILPVAVGMLWFPYIRRLDVRWTHAVLAFSGGLLAFIAVEMAEEAADHAVAVPDPVVGGSVAVVGAVGTIAVMESVSRWRRSKSSAAMSDGLRVAYFVAIGLGIHSVGEGLAIGGAFVTGETGLVLLLSVGFIMHNVTEGPAVISAVAREAESPPIRHFALLGILAGGGVIVGGWLGSLVDSPLLAAACFAIAFGAIVQVLWEMRGLVLADGGDLLTVRTATAFAAGVVVMFFLEEVLVGAWLLG